MADSRSVKLTDDTYRSLNTLKIRIAVSRNEIPTVSAIVDALLVLGTKYYDELIQALTEREAE